MAAGAGRESRCVRVDHLSTHARLSNGTPTPYGTSRVSTHHPVSVPSRVSTIPCQYPPSRVSTIPCQYPPSRVSTIPCQYPPSRFSIIPCQYHPVSIPNIPCQYPPSRVCTHHSMSEPSRVSTHQGAAHDPQGLLLGCHATHVPAVVGRRPVRSPVQTDGTHLMLHAQDVQGLRAARWVPGLGRLRISRPGWAGLACCAEDLRSTSCCVFETQDVKDLHTDTQDWCTDCYAQCAGLHRACIQPGICQ